MLWPLFTCAPPLHVLCGLHAECVGHACPPLGRAVRVTPSLASKRGVRRDEGRKWQRDYPHLLLPHLCNPLLHPFHLHAGCVNWEREAPSTSDPLHGSPAQGDVPLRSSARGNFGMGVSPALCAIPPAAVPLPRPRAGAALWPLSSLLAYVPPRTVPQEPTRAHRPACTCTPPRRARAGESEPPQGAAHNPCSGTLPSPFPQLVTGVTHK